MEKIDFQGQRKGRQGRARQNEPVLISVLIVVTNTNTGCLVAVVIMLFQQCGKHKKRGPKLC